MTTANAGYENAPSTLMLAQACACCGRALRDAESVERGVGPDCAAKYGFGIAQGSPDWAAALTALGELRVSMPDPTKNAVIEAWHNDARRVSNLLVHRAACEHRREPRLMLARAIALLGFVRLAGAVARAASEVCVSIEIEQGTYVLKAPYDESFAPMVRAARIGATFDRPSKTWRVPTEPRARVALWDILRRVYQGATLVSPRGVTVLEGGV